MFLRHKFLLAISLFLLLLSACAPQPSAQTPSPQQPSGGLVIRDKAPFTVAAIAALSQKLKVAAEKVSFVSADSVEWSDSCLGLGGPAESCLQALMPGYKVILSVDGKPYEVHTNETGSVVRVKE